MKKFLKNVSGYFTFDEWHGKGTRRIQFLGLWFVIDWGTKEFYLISNSPFPLGQYHYKGKNT